MLVTLLRQRTLETPATRAENLDNPDELVDNEREFNAGAPPPIQYPEDVITPGNDEGDSGGSCGEARGGEY